MKKQTAEELLDLCREAVDSLNSQDFDSLRYILGEIENWVMYEKENATE